MARAYVDSDTKLSPEGLEQLTQLLAGTPVRLSSAQIDGRTVWIKRFDTEGRSIPEALHALASPLLPLTFMRSSPRANPEQLCDREARKSHAFQMAGFQALVVLYRRGPVLAVAEVHEILEPKLHGLRDADPAAHDELLVDMAGALGQIHAAGLCHGRPHPRDMYLNDLGWGFIDFEEEPEAAMPLAAAQARDVWLAFAQITYRAVNAATPVRAFRAWQTEAPFSILPELRRIGSFFSAFGPPLRMLQPILGKDGKRLLVATELMRSVLRDDHTRAQLRDRKDKPDEVRTPI